MILNSSHSSYVTWPWVCLFACQGGFPKLLRGLRIPPGVIGIIIRLSLIPKARFGSWCGHRRTASKESPIQSPVVWSTLRGLEEPKVLSRYLRGQIMSCSWPTRTRSCFCNQNQHTGGQCRRHKVTLISNSSPAADQMKSSVGFRCPFQTGVWWLMCTIEKKFSLNLLFHYHCSFHLHTFFWSFRDNSFSQWSCVMCWNNTPFLLFFSTPWTVWTISNCFLL